jgi:hypothetical protein
MKATVDELLIAEIGRRHRSHAALDDGGVLGMLAAIPDATDPQDQYLRLPALRRPRGGRTHPDPHPR